jgi:hypothetical protein
MGENINPEVVFLPLMPCNLQQKKLFFRAMGIYTYMKMQKNTICFR